MKLGGSFEDGALLRQLSNLEHSQLPYAGAMALNDTAKDVLEHIQGRMDVVFDRPTRFTKNAFMIRWAKKGQLEAQVKERPSVGKKHYLKIQEVGGLRPNTALEKLLSQRVAFEGHIAAVVPDEGARRDGFGNWSSAHRNQVLSAIGAQRDVRSNETEKSKKRKKSKVQYFVPKAGQLSPGVWSREGEDLKKVLTFTTAMPKYQKRLAFYNSAAMIWSARLPRHLRRWLDIAVASAR